MFPLYLNLFSKSFVCKNSMYSCLFILYDKVLTKFFDSEKNEFNFLSFKLCFFSFSVLKFVNDFFLLILQDLFLFVFFIKLLIFSSMFNSEYFFLIKYFSSSLKFPINLSCNQRGLTNFTSFSIANF